MDKELEPGPGPGEGSGGDRAAEETSSRDHGGRKPRRVMRLAALILVAILALGGAFFIGHWSGGGDSAAAASGTTAVTTTTESVADSTATTVPAISTDEPVADVAEALAPSVVQLQSDRGLGSGVIYDADGFILTAAHVVAGVDVVEVRLADGSRLEGRVIGRDDESDVAVVQIDATGLAVAPVGSSDDLRVGQMAIAIGSPWGLDQTVTAGVVSSTRRALAGPDGVVRTMIQTDAPINPGNSGGALADRSGRVIGINDSIYSTSGGSDGVGFAIPIDTAASVAERLQAGEEIRPALLGVRGTDPESGRAGALITGIEPGSGADEAGLLVGDLVTAYDGQTVETFIDLAGYVRDSLPGDRVTLTVMRGGDQIEIEATLHERSD